MKLLRKLFPGRTVRQSIADLVGIPCSFIVTDPAMPPEKVAAAFGARVAALAQRIDKASAADNRQALRESEEEGDRLPMEIIDGVAHIPIDGLLLPSGAALWRWWGLRATDYQEITAMVHSALADPRVRSILLDIDSPGGYVRGATTAADAIFGARGQKPITAHTAGLMASCAYHLGSQADRITADRRAIVGSIGEMVVLVDASRYYKEAGLEVVVIRSGAHKGAGVWGAEITDEQKAAYQELVNDGFELFLQDILRARDMDEKKLRDAADGRAFYSARALKAGLIDGIETAPAAAAALASASPAEDEEPDEGEEPEASRRAQADASRLEPRNTTEGAAGAENDETTPDGGEGGNMPKTVDEFQAELQAKEAELAEERAKREKAEASAEMAALNAQAAKADRLAAIVDSHIEAGRVAPADRAKYVELANKGYGEDPDGLDALLATFRPVTKAERKSAPVVQELAYATLETPDDRAGNARLAQAMGVTPEDLQKMDEVEGVSTTGNVVRLRGGKDVKVAEYGGAS